MLEQTSFTNVLVPGCSNSTRSATRDVQCSDKLRASSVALSRSEQRGSAARLSCHRRRSSDVTACAWRGLTKTSDRQHINSVIDRVRRLGYCSPDLPTFDELCDIADDELYGNVVRWSNHVLRYHLHPPRQTLQPQTPSSLPTVARTLNTLIRL